MTEWNEAQEQGPSPSASRGWSSQGVGKASGSVPLILSITPPPACFERCAIIPDRAALLQDEIGARDVGTISLFDVVEGPVGRTVAEAAAQGAPSPSWGPGAAQSPQQQDWVVQTDRLTPTARIYWVSLRCWAPTQTVVPAFVKLIYRRKRITNQEVKGKLQRESVP